ncbi:hypothetical protein ACFWV1_32975 [Streptomyces sp. NPDC058700]
MIHRILHALGITAIWTCTQCGTNNADTSTDCMICDSRHRGAL